MVTEIRKDKVIAEFVVNYNTHIKYVIIATYVNRNFIGKIFLFAIHWDKLIIQHLQLNGIYKARENIYHSIGIEKIYIIFFKILLESC